MIETGFKSRVKIQDIIENQLPEFILDENPKTVDFLKQYYASQEYQGGPVDIAENLDQYLKLDNLVPEVIVDETLLSGNIDSNSNTISVSSTKGFPDKYGLLKIDDEIITYTGITTNTFTGCVRGFSGISNYHDALNTSELVFSDTISSSHVSGSNIQNLSSLFLKEFYKKLKYTFAPGFEDRELNSNLNIGNFIRLAKSFYSSKGTEDSFRILFNVLYGEDSKIINLEDYLFKCSDADYLRREKIVAEVISGNPMKLIGQTIYKNSDVETNATISSIEPFTRKGIQYFTIDLFVGYSDSSAINGIFEITPNTKSIENVSISDSVITVDSTIGFDQSGTIKSGSNSISYTNKSINQFLGCSGISSIISKKDNLYLLNKIYYGYEDGDISKKVELRLTGVLSDFVQQSKSIISAEGQILTVKGIGDNIKNPESDKTYKEIFANSWIYNTSSTIEIDQINSSIIILKNTIDRSQLKKGDEIEIIDRGSSNVVFPLSISDIPYVDTEISGGSNQISVSNFNFTPDPNASYSLRRRIKKAVSSTVPFKYGNNTFISDVQNLYVDDKFGYVASNSLPSYTGNTNFFEYQILKEIRTSVINSSSGNLIDLDNDTGLNTTLLFDVPVPFITGEKIYYSPGVGSESLIGLESGSYYVKVLSDPKKIKLFSALSLISNEKDCLKFIAPVLGIGEHNFIAYSQKSGVIDPDKVLKKFPILPTNIKDGNAEETPVGSIGMLVNGVEISNYKTTDKVYYGPIKDVNVLFGGEDFDVVNPPKIQVSSSLGLGTTALVQPVVQGTIEYIFVDEQNFDVNQDSKIKVIGGNISGGSFTPVVIRRRREILFDGRSTSDGGGIDVSTNQLTFLKDHNLTNGQRIVYRNNGNNSISIGIGLSSLIDNSTYYAKVDNNSTIQLFESLNDYNANSNAIGFANTSLSGTHKFLTGEIKNAISEIKIIDGGTVTNRKLLVKPSGISTTTNLIKFENHGFSNGEFIEYSPIIGLGVTLPQAISGLTTTTQYSILTVDDNSFRLCDSGIGGTNTTNFDQGNYVNLNSQGTGFQQFKYPNLEVVVEFTSAGIGTDTQSQVITATPVVKGEIIDLYLYEEGTKYGSETLNFEAKPRINVKDGNNGQIAPIILNGSVIDANLQFGGFDYFSTPTLKVIDPTGYGSGAELRSIVSSDGKISEVKVVNPGIGYSTSSRIEITSSGKGAIFDSSVRELIVNNVDRVSNKNYDVLKESDNGLSYNVSAYYSTIQDSFQEDENVASKIIGWAYDGNPIYGPYGISDIDNLNSQIKTISSSYSSSLSNIVDRPSSSSFPLGFFIDDYVYDGSGDLDKNNGRFSKTPDFPNGIYAYYSTIDSFTNNPVFPYFIGNTFRSNTLDENKTLDQSFDFNNSNLFRNTLPYKVLDKNSGNDFLTESNEITRQKIKVESVTKGKISKFDIINSGKNYKIGDKLLFKSNEDNIIGIEETQAKVSSIKGESITQLETIKETFNDVTLIWNNDRVVGNIVNHQIKDEGFVTISGFSTTNLSNLNGFFQVSVNSIQNEILIENIPSSGAASTEIYLSNIPESISVGSSISIGAETLQVLNIFPAENILRIKRGNVGLSHTIGDLVSFGNDSFEIDKKIGYFESKLNRKIYFNPNETVGVGTTSGSAFDTSFDFANRNLVRSIPTQRIYLESHGLKDNQLITFNTGGNTTLSISTSSEGTPFNISSPSNFFVVNKSPNTIGIKTSLISDELFFRTNGDNEDDYFFETNFDERKGKVEKITTTLSISTSHGLTVGDQIELNVKPNFSVGIGTSTHVKLTRNNITDNLQINSIGFSSVGINTNSNQIQLPNHELITGDKVFYESSEVASGLETGSYFIFRIDDNNIKLSKTYNNSKLNPPITVDILDVGGTTQKISKINPQIKVIKNNNLVFDVSDTSLSGYQLKFYYDKEFVNEFVSIASTSSFNVIGVGTIGVSADAKITLNYDSEIPDRIYYNLEKTGKINKFDTDVSYYSEILFTNSLYNNSYTVSGIGSTTFDIGLQNLPEKLSYTSSDCDVLEYDTTSNSAKGSVDKIDLISAGSGYKKIPEVYGTNSTEGENLYAIPVSESIGNIDDVRVINQGFEYSSDKTLQPKAFISPQLTLTNSNSIGIVTVVDGGKNFITPPEIIVVDNSTRTIVDNGILKSVLSGSSINYIEIDVSPKGISNESAELFTVNNSNGISVKSVKSVATGIFTCVLTTPGPGFSTNPFSIGDEVFIEGIQIDEVAGIQATGSSGDGFNSSDYGYKFFKVTNYLDKSEPGLSDDEVTLDISNLTSNTGIAKQIQDSTGVIVNRSNYPSFNISLEKSLFLEGETLISNGIERDLIVLEYDDSSSVKVFGSYDLSLGEVITGKSSGNVATINSIVEYDGYFKVDYSTRKNEGWSKDTGKLSEDYQVLPDNDYYQNLSYSIKSSQQWEDIKSPVNNLVHISGLKNFSDTQIISDSKNNVGVNSTNDQTLIVKDIIEENRVDTINNFDFVKDVDVLNNVSRFLKLKSKKLSNFTEVGSNIVLKIDDISNQFSRAESEPVEYVNILQTNFSDPYVNYLLKVRGLNNNQIQLTNLIIINDENNENSFILDKSSILNDGLSTSRSSYEGEYGEFVVETDLFGDSYLKFVPTDPFNIEYDIKFVEKKFTYGFGSGTFSNGFIDIISDSREVLTGVTTEIVGVSTENISSFYVNAHIMEETGSKMNAVELYVTQDGNNTNISEYYFDTSKFDRSMDLIGSFTADIDGGLFKLKYQNNSSLDVIVKSRIVGFGKTSVVGVSTYRFKSTQQPDGSERTALYQSGFSTTTSGISTSVLALNKNNFDSVKSLIEVGVGTVKSIHQILLIQDGSDVYTQQSQFMTIENDLGIGTFGGQYTGSDFELMFYPDSNVTDDINITSFNECLYSDVDFINKPNDLIYGKSIDTVKTSQYFAINGERINRKNFVLRNNNIPIFAKTFDPSDSSILNSSTGVFSIDNHFFSDNEEIIYTPKSTFVGIGSTPLMYSNGSTVGVLSSPIFIKNKTDSTFQISTTRDGTAVTFVSLGEGNAHQFEMAKKTEKSIININNLAQYPLAPKNISYSLNLDTGIDSNSEIISFNNITNINPNDILKIDDEYVKVSTVGLGTNTNGPIINSGTKNLAQVERAFFGSKSISHSTSSTVNVYKGSYTIIGDEIFFTNPPRGNVSISRNDNNLEFETSDFSGRVFLRGNYDSNQIYDDISDEFTGIGRTYSMTVGGANTSGIGTIGENGVVFINGIFQTPTTANNPNKNFSILEQTTPSPGITSIVFSGIRTDPGDANSVLSVVNDTNQNQIPRGGIIVSLGSSGGLGYAPLSGAKVVPTVSAGGTITSIIGVSTYTSNLGIQTTSYNKVTGVLEITTPTKHDLNNSNKEVWLENLEFSCDNSHAGVTTTIFPDGTIGNIFRIIGIVSERTFNVDIGVSTIPHSYVGSGNVYPYFNGLNFGSGYVGNVSIAVTDGSAIGSGSTITATVGAGGTLSFNIVDGGSNYVNPQITIPEPSYENLEVIGVSRVGLGDTTETGVGLLLDLEVTGTENTILPTSLENWAVFQSSSYNIIGNGNALDSLNNIYVVSTIENVPTGLGGVNSEANKGLLTKYNQYGETQWQLVVGNAPGSYATIRFSDISINSSTNDIFVCGSWQSDVGGDYKGLVLKVSTDGTLQWKKTTDTFNPGNSNISQINDTEFYDIFVENTPDSDILVSGYTKSLTNDNSVPYDNYYMVRYDKDGTNRQEYISGIATGISTSPTVSRSVISNTSGDPDYWILGDTFSSNLGVNNIFIDSLKTDNTVGIVSMQTFDFAKNQISRDMAMDSNGNIYFTGTSYDLNDSSDPGEIILAKYNTSTYQLDWKKTIGSGRTESSSIAIDSNNNIYVTGFTTSLSNDSILVIKTNTSGTIQWQRTFTGSLNNYGNSISVDDTNLYITGNAGNNAITLKLPTDGGLTGTYGGYSYSTANLPTSEPIPPENSLLASLTITREQFNSPSLEYYNRFTGIDYYNYYTRFGHYGLGSPSAKDANGNIYCAFSARYEHLFGIDMNSDHFTLLVKYNSEGEIQWVKHIFDDAYSGSSQSGVNNPGAFNTFSIEASSGYIYLFGNSTRSTARDAYPVILKLNQSDGSIEWARYLHHPDYNGDIGLIFSSSYGNTIDGNGDIITVGQALVDDGSIISSTYFNSGFITKLNSLGNLLWSRRLSVFDFNNPNNDYNNQYSYSSVRDVITDSSNNVYVVGSASTSMMPSSSDVDSGLSPFIVKYDVNGNIQWQKEYNTEGFPASQRNFYADYIEIDSSDNLYVLKRSQRSSTTAFSKGRYAVLTKYNTSGIVQWSMDIVSSTYTEIRSIDDLKIDSSDNAYILTTAMLNATSGYVVLITKINSSGVKQWSKILSSTYNLYAGSMEIISNQLYISFHRSQSATWGGRSMLIKMNIDGTTNFVDAVSTINLQNDTSVSVASTTYILSNCGLSTSASAFDLTNSPNFLSIDSSSASDDITSLSITPSSVGIETTISFDSDVYYHYPTTDYYIADADANWTGSNSNNTTTSSITGIGDIDARNYFWEVSNFKISRPGYGFQRGDVFKPVGLVTAIGIGSDLQEFELTVLDTYSDSFAAWQFGELDFIDSIKNYQDGSRVRFPLYYNDNLLSFETKDDSIIDLSSSLIVIINGVMQDPGTNYSFEGGTSFAFTTPPKPEDEINIFFYRGTRDQDDSLILNVIPTLERGDTVRVVKNNSIPSTVSQEDRVIFDLASSDKFETNTYTGDGIDEINDKLLSWTKQKSDRQVNGEFVYKTRQSIISQIYPVVKVIGDVNSGDTEIFIDDPDLFKYNLGSEPYQFSAFLIDGKVSTAANITSTINTEGLVTSLTVIDSGSGYIYNINGGNIVDVKFSSPPIIGPGIGTTATATVSIGPDGSLTTPITITNPGFGYTLAPLVLVSPPSKNYENITKVESIKGFSGIITGISTTSGIGGHPLAIKFFLDRETSFGNDLNVGNPILITNTHIGSGVTSVNSNDNSIVNISNIFLDNIYVVNGLTIDGNVGIVTCNVHSQTDVSGISTSGDFCGKFCWGAFRTITRSSSPISIAVTGKEYNLQLDSFPTIQRRGEGIRETGAAAEKLD